MMSCLYTGLPNTPADIVYHGLVNQGATCYLNSVLQVLFMTEDFREAVERCSPHNPECIDPQLREVFDELLKKTSKTNDITKKLGIHTVWEQRDAAEYFEKILTLTSSEASQIFHGESTRKITCSCCRKENNTDGRFWYLPLELVDSHSDIYSVVDGIDEYFRTSDFSGENQMYCDNCETKSDATMTCVMKHHPDVLALLLKRFDFDYRYMSYVKNNRVVDVPSFLQIPENQTYELYACVDHFGDLRGGHYTATIKSQENEKWYYFNDASVTLLDYQPFQNVIIESSNSAYLLFYRKKQNIHTQEISEVFTNGGLPLPVAGHDGDEFPDVGQMTEREEGMEVEETAEVGNGKTESVSIDRNEGTGIKENVSVGSAGPDIHQDLKPESIDREATCDSLVSTDKKEDKEEMEVDDSKGKTGANKLTSDPGNLTKCPHCGNVFVSGQSPPLVIVDKKSVDEKTRTDDKEEKGGKTGRLELLTKDDVYLEGCEDTGDVGAGEQGGSSRLLERSEHQKDERREEKGDKETKGGNDKDEHGSQAKPDCSESVADQDEGGLDDGGQNGPEDTIGVHEGVGAEEQAKEHKEPSQSGTGELRENQGGEGVEEMENSQPTERAVVEDGGGSDKKILYGINDEEMRTDDKEETEGVGAGEQGGSSGLLERSEQQKDERREEKGDKEPKRGNDEAAQGSTTKPDCSECVEDQDEGGLDDGGQNGPQDTIGVHEGVGAEEQAKEHKEPSQSGTGELRENQGGEGVEEMENSQSTERAVVEGGGGSDKTILHGVIIEKEIKQTSSGVKEHIERTPIRIKRRRSQKDEDTL